MNEAGKKIKTIMNEKNLSYGDLSNITKIPKSALHRYATGETEKIPLDRLEVIARALNTPTAYLAGWEEDSQDINVSIYNDVKSLGEYEYQILTGMKDLSSESKKKLLERLNELRMMENINK